MFAVPQQLLPTCEFDMVTEYVDTEADADERCVHERHHDGALLQTSVPGTLQLLLTQQDVEHQLLHGLKRLVLNVLLHGAGLLHVDIMERAIGLFQQ